MATPLLPSHSQREGHTKGEIHERIGSTGEGVGAARQDWMSRNRVVTEPFGELAQRLRFEGKVQVVSDTAELLSLSRRIKKSIMLEGTQGFGLSLTHGTWPYCTSTDTTAGQLAVDAGIPPRALTDVIMVARTFPIRVAGNSGPMKDETDWDSMSERLHKKVVEQTTVTKLTRRVGAWDEELVQRACNVNGPTEIALTFMDYMAPEDEGVTHYDELSDRSLSFIDYVERFFETPVALIGTGFSVEKGWTCVDRNR